MSQPTWVPAFLKFLRLVKISSKELSEPAAIDLYEAQIRFLEQVVSGVDQGARHFVCLKARQLGISTLMLVFDIFWLYFHPGLQGALIADTAENKETFRQTITEMLESLPTGYRIPIKTHNRTALTLANGSRLQYMSAGKGKNSGLGRSRALNYVHATECSSWGDQKGLESLLAALAQENPNRLYVFESTALGYNLFFDMYAEAKADGAMQKAFFIGWWAKEVYRLKEGSAEFDRYWTVSPKFTEEEEVKVALVKAKYRHDITPEQIAWYRWMQTRVGESSLAEEYPWTEDEAWQTTGSSFFSLKRVNDDIGFIYSQRIGFNGFTYKLGDTFLATRLEAVNSPELSDLRVWEEPKPHGRYVLGVDPAYGRSENADRSVISVWRCYADKLVQVAEYATAKPESQQVAWVMAHIAGCYRDCMINLEITGPGAQVMAELKYLKQQIRHGQLREPAIRLNLADCLDTARWYLWHRPDSMGAGYAYGFKTGWDSKALILNNYRDAFNTELIIARSVPLLEEMTKLVQNGDSIQASGRNKDDRVMAAALANYAWAEWIRNGMMQEQRTFEREQQKEHDLQDQGDDRVIKHIIPDFFARAAAARQEREIQQLWEQA